MPTDDIPKTADNYVKMISGVVALLVAIIAVLAPIAYLFGFAYYDGYMSAFGVDSGGLSISIQMVYVYSYQVFSFFLWEIAKVVGEGPNRLTSSPNVFWVVTCFVLTVGVLYGLQKAMQKTTKPSANKQFEKVKEIVFGDFTKSIGIVFITWYSFVVLATGLITVALLWALLSLWPYAKGQFTATEQIKLFLEKGCHIDEKSKWNNCSFIIDEKGKTIHEGFLIGINDGFIAILKKDGSYVFKRKDGFVLRRKRNES